MRPEQRRNIYLTQYIHINYPDDSVEAGFDWNIARLLRRIDEVSAFFNTFGHNLLI